MRKRKLFWLIIGVCCILIIVVAATVLISGDPEPAEQETQSPPDGREVASLFMETVLENDGPAGFDLMSPRLQDQLGSAIRWSRFLTANFEGKDKGLTLLESDDIQSSESKKPFRIVYMVDFGDRASRRIELVIRYIDGSWKVDEFTSPIN